MQKYRVLKSYPKQITNSGRLVTLKPGAKVYLKKEAQVLRLVRLGFLKPVVEMPKRKKSKPVKKKQPQEVKVVESQPSQEPEQKEEEKEYKRKSKSEYLNKKKNRSKAKDE